MSSNVSDQKKERKPGPVEQFKSGPIVAAVWLRRTQTGMPYLEYSLERLWKGKTSDRWQRSGNYFAGNTEHIIAVAETATAFIREHQDDPEALIGGDSGVKDIASVTKEPPKTKLREKPQQDAHAANVNGSEAAC